MPGAGIPTYYLHLPALRCLAAWPGLVVKTGIVGQKKVVATRRKADLLFSVMRNGENDFSLLFLYSLLPYCGGALPYHHPLAFSNRWLAHQQRVAVTEAMRLAHLL